MDINMNIYTDTYIDTGHLFEKNEDNDTERKSIQGQGFEIQDFLET